MEIVLLIYLLEQVIQYIDFEQKIEDTILQQRLARFPFVPHDDKKRDERCDLILTMQANGLKKRIEHINCKKVVVGLSGGLDSALAILVAAKAMDLLGRDRKDTSRIMRLERSAYNRGRSMPRSYPYVSRNTTEDECIKFYGISKRKE